MVPQMGLQYPCSLDCGHQMIIFFTGGRVTVAVLYKNVTTPAFKERSIYVFPHVQGHERVV